MNVETSRPLLRASESGNVNVRRHRVHLIARVLSVDKTAFIGREERMNSLQLVAKWLYENIAEGDLFTTHDLRTAIPGVEQIDRRMRDLRDHGWVIDTYREDGSLSAEQKRLVHVGAHLWE